MRLTNKIGRRLYQYTIDIANNQEIRGWCFQILQPNTPVRLQFFAGKELLGETVANLNRTDVKSRGVHPTGACGFHYRFPVGLKDEKDKRLAVRAGVFNTEIYSSALSALPAVIAGKLPQILFMHIPKTAGTSFNSFARSYFPQARTITHIEAENSAEYSGFTRQYDFISGHLPLLTLRKHFKLEQLELFSIVREPYAHLHSHFNWINAIATQSASGFAREQPQVVRDLANRMQTLELTDPGELHTFVRGLGDWELNFFDNLQTRYFLDHSPERVEPGHLSEALDNLHLFSAVGLTEQYESFSRTFCERIGTDYRAQPNALNRARAQPLFDLHNSEIRQALKPLVFADLELYDTIRPYWQ